jgi:hypothetical protein
MGQEWPWRPFDRHDAATLKGSAVDHRNPVPRKIALAEADPTTLPTPIPTTFNVTALGQAVSRVARTTIQRQLKTWLDETRAGAA